MKNLIFLCIINLVLTGYAQNNFSVKENWKEFKIVDQENLQPIPFASISIEEEEIYRVSDENGIFNLPIVALRPNSVVKIYSLGYYELIVGVNNLQPVMHLEQSVDELATVVLYNKSPYEILKQAIKRIEYNYPNDPLNYKRYSELLINENDTTFFDVGLVAKEYVEGYTQVKKPKRIVEEVKWNKNLQNYDKYKYSEDLFGHRENPIQYSPIFHKKKYKRFDLSYSTSADSLYKDAYIIDFEIETDDWSFTNRGYRTKYFGKIIIKQDDYAIIEVEENWEATLKDKEIKNSEKWINTLGTFKDVNDIVLVKIKEQQSSKFDKSNSGDYIATYFYRKSYFDQVDFENNLHNSYSVYNSNLYSYQTEQVEEISFVKNDSGKTRLTQLKFDPDYWKSFKLNELVK
ncbi:MAG: hypothetical protein ACQEWG_16745 [Bacteroidota bacterium]